MSQHEEFDQARADRPPTPEEEAAADNAARDVDVDAVAAEYQHMAELGANVEGEGEIEPRRSDGDAATRR